MSTPMGQSNHETAAVARYASGRTATRLLAMKNMTGTLALAVLLLGAGVTPALADCKKGTICWQLIHDQYGFCLAGARQKWRAILDFCKQAKKAKNPAACRAAIRAGLKTSVVKAELSEASATCTDPSYPIDCGTFCCPSTTPVCEPGGACCAPHGLTDCCCPSAQPLCLSDGNCYATTTTTTSPPSVTTTTQPSCGVCNDQQVAGGDTPDTRVIELGQSSGTSQFDFDTFTIPDEIIVTYEGRVLLDTGCVGTSGSMSLTYSGSSTQMTVEVRPNCQGGTSGTAWQYTLHCPR